MSYIHKVRIGTKQINNILKSVETFLDKKNNSIFHIANINPEIFMLATKNSYYRKIINNANELLIDGIGIIILAKIIGVAVGEKLAGTDLITKLIEIASQKRKKVLFLGGFKETAKKTAIFFQNRYSHLKIGYTSGAQNIKKETTDENIQVLNYIGQFKPDFIFVAYGPPWQEKWIYKNRDKLKGIVCMGVGGSFNFYSNQVRRAPNCLIHMRLEWLWRFILEPQRIITKGPSYIYFLMYSLLFCLDKRIITRCFSRKNITTIKT